MVLLRWAFRQLLLTYQLVFQAGQLSAGLALLAGVVCQYLCIAKQCSDFALAVKNLHETLGNDKLWRGSSVGSRDIIGDMDVGGLMYAMWRIEAGDVASLETALRRWNYAPMLLLFLVCQYNMNSWR